MRPQLLDRFGLSVNVSTMQDTKVRTQMVLDRLAYDSVGPLPAAMVIGKPTSHGNVAQQSSFCLASASLSPAQLVLS